MKLIGSIYYNKEELIYSDDLIRFKQGGINQIPSEVDSEYLSDWAYFLSKPWSASNIKYITKINQAAKNDNEFYVTIYEVVGYDALTANIRGYGKTPQESMQKCIDNYNKIQSTYNVEH